MAARLLRYAKVRSSQVKAHSATYDVIHRSPGSSPFGQGVLFGQYKKKRDQYVVYIIGPPGKLQSGNAFALFPPTKNCNSSA